MEGPSPEERVEWALSNLLGKKSSVLKSDTSGRTVKFPTGDTVFLPEDLKFSLNKQQLRAFARLALTTPDHALAGFLLHVACEVYGRPFTFRVGGGQYPIPILGKAVDWMNVQLGPELWSVTDTIRDLEFYKNNPEAFEKFYGSGTLDRVEAIAFTPNWDGALRQTESFLGQGDGVFLGDLNPGPGTAKKVLSLGRLNLIPAGLGSRIVQRLTQKEPTETPPAEFEHTRSVSESIEPDIHSQRLTKRTPNNFSKPKKE